MLLRTRITLVAVLASVTVAGIMFLYGYNKSERMETRYHQAIANGQESLWQTIAENQSELIAGNITSLTRDWDLLDALAQQNQTEIDANAQPTFNRLEASGVINRMQLVEANGRIVFSTVDGLRGQTNRTPMVREAQNSNNIITGVQKDQDGMPTSTVIIPLFSRVERGQIAAYAVLSRTLTEASTDVSADALDLYSRNTGADAAIFGLDDQLLGVSGDVIEQLAFSLPEAGETQVAIERDNDHIYTTTAVPVRDLNGEPIAHLVSAVDDTAYYNAQVHADRIGLSLALLALILAMAGLYWMINRSFAQLHATIATMKQIAAGDLRQKMHAKRADEIGELSQSMNQMSQDLTDMVGRVNQSASKLADWSNNLADGSRQVHENSERERKETEMVASAMNEMTSTVADVAANADNASQSAQNASQTATQGAEQVSETISGIEALASEIQHAASVVGELREDSENIGSILDVISAIAEQTNLLALNAAIEAARAGESGRGFAVVAEEVRSLANRTQQSTTEIQNMIEKLQNGAARAVTAMQSGEKQVNDSVAQVAQAGESMQAIDSEVQQIFEMNRQIADAAQQQSEVADEINRNLSNIVDLVEQNATHVGQTIESIDELARLSSQLEEMLSRFKI